MSFAVSAVNPAYTTSAVLAKIHSFGASIGDAFNATTQKIKDAVASPVGQGVVGFGLGVGIHKIYMPLTEKIVKFFGVSALLPDPFMGLGLGFKILSTPFICVIHPIMEEEMFRGGLQEVLKEKLNSFYMNLGLSDSGANTASRMTSVFFASLIFGLSHLANAIVFWCNPVLFLPQVVATTIAGLIFGLAKEFSGELHMPIGMHIGNNTLSWSLYIKASL